MARTKQTARKNKSAFNPPLATFPGGTDDENASDESRNIEGKRKVRIKLPKLT